MSSKVQSRSLRSRHSVTLRPLVHPRFVEPCHPTERDRAPSGSNWLHEIKLDGYRAQLHLREGKAIVYSRRGHDWTEQFSAIARAAEKLGVRDAVLDGEVIVQDAAGMADYHALRRELARKHSDRLIYYAFDLLFLDGVDLRPRPLHERKRRLEQLLNITPPGFLYAQHLERDGETVFAQACEMGVEGIVSKRADAPYRSGRQESWLKVKCTKSDSVPIIAFVEKLGAKPRRIASFYIGRWEGSRLLYAGKVQGGFTMDETREVRERLDPLIRKTSPLSVRVKKPKATWVEPTMLAEVRYSSVTQDGLLREPVFKGLREDLADTKAPAAPPAAHRSRGGVPRENILQLLPDAVVPSKEVLAAYWHKVHKQALRYLARRPLKLVRHTRGTTFYHKGRLPLVPESVHQLRIEKRQGGEGVRLWVDDLEGLLGLVEIGVVEVHPWAAKVDDYEHADALVFDLDPGSGIAWQIVTETALGLRELLKSDGLTSWPKTTGGKGLHVMAPLDRKLTHDAAHAFAKRLAQHLASLVPDLYITTADPQQRSGKLFIDYLRNGRGTTAVGAYSPRARPGFPIAAPVTWKDVERGVAAGAFTMERPSRRGH
jgi:bifunctional non-homologous end joining protein LigD